MNCNERRIKNQKKILSRRAFCSTSWPSRDVAIGVDFDLFIPFTVRARCNNTSEFSLNVSRSISGCVCLLFNWLLFLIFLRNEHTLVIKWPEYEEKPEQIFVRTPVLEKLLFMKRAGTQISMFFT